MSLRSPTAQLTFITQGVVHSMQQKKPSRTNENKKRKMEFEFQWKVSPLRQDKRTGPTRIFPIDPYVSYLMKEESKRINPRQGLDK